MSTTDTADWYSKPLGRMTVVSHFYSAPKNIRY